ncbi:MAG: tetratricopeptide repeat protein [Bacteroidia bacterium]|nr:tetratricopeptide repeat protein [Bacteroidia bacterium]
MKEIEIDTLNAKAWQLRYKDMPKAYELGRQALDLSQKINYFKGIAYAKLNYALCSFLLSKEENILEMLLDSLKYFEKNPGEKGYAGCLYYLGNVYEHHGDYDNGMKYCMKGLRVAEQLGLKEEQGDALSVIGLIYSRLSDFEQAIENYKKSFAIREDIHDMKAAASSLNLIARSYALMCDYPSAIEYYQKSLILRKEMNDSGGLPWTYIGLASLYEKMDDHEKAIGNYHASLDANSHTNDKRCDLYCNLGLGKIYTQQKETNAIDYLTKALDIANTLGAKPLIYELHLALAGYYEMTGDLKKSLEYFKQFHKLKEEVLNIETHNKIKRQQIRFAVEKSEKEAEIYQLRNVELKAAFDEIAEKNYNITASIRYALRIQKTILPPDESIARLLPEHFIFYKPRNIVSGDFYWVEEHEGLVFFAAVDCTGHGVPGAFMSIIGNNFLNQALHENHIHRPSEILNYLSKEINSHLRKKDCEDIVQDGMDLTLCRIDREKMIMEFAGVHNPLYFTRNNELIVHKPDSYPVGEPFDEEFTGYTNNEIPLQKGDLIYIFSDGFPDQFGGTDRKKFMSRRFREILLDIRNLSMPDQKIKLGEVFDNWKGSVHQVDDVLVMGVRI